MSQPVESARYRIRHDDQISPWMTAEQLRQAAMIGQVPPQAMVQQAGQAEWHEAANIKGLQFPAEQQSENNEAATKEQIETHPRFKTMRDLLANFLHCPVSINLVESTSFDEAELLLCCEDHFEISLPTYKIRAFVPYARIKAIASIELEGQGQKYRDSHTVRIEIEPCSVFSNTTV